MCYSAVIHRYRKIILILTFYSMRMQGYCDVYKWTILKRTSPEVKCLHPTSSRREMCTSSVIALSRILETVVTFHFSGGMVYSMNKGCHTCIIKHTMHVQSVHRSIYLTWLDVCIYVPRSHFHFLKRMLGKGQLRTA